MLQDSPIKILVIVDDDGLSAHVVQTLVAAGYEVHLASNDDEGMYRATDWDYDAIVLDLLLPRLSSRVLMEALSARPTDTPIVLYSALGESSYRGRIHAADNCEATDHECYLLARLRAVLPCTPAICGDVV